MKEFPFDPYDFFGYIANGLLLIVGLNLIIGVPNILGKDLKPLDMLALSLAVYIAGQIIASPAKWLLEGILVTFILKTPSVNLMANRDKKSFLKLFFPGYYETLPITTQNKIIEKVQKEGLNIYNGEELFVHIRYQENMLSDSNLISRLNTFLNKYGFNRNLCFTSMLFGICILIFKEFNIATSITKYGILFVFTSIFLFYRYIKFFRLYSFELFNTYAGKK